MDKRRVEVVGAVIRDGAGRILCALRGKAMSMPDLWEFPGGKIEEGESPEVTLIREIREELGCEIEVLGPFERTAHAYEEILVDLRLFEARICSGEPTPHEHAAVRWVAREQLHEIAWSPADIAAVRRLQEEVSLQAAQDHISLPKNATVIRLALRQAIPEDADHIARFNQGIAWETEKIKLEWPRILAGVTAMIAEPSRGGYLLALEGERIVGQLAITYEWSDWRNGNFWWIQSVYVDAGYRQRGVYRALHEHIRQQAIADPQCCGLRLYVEEDNAPALTAYLRLGMKRSYYRIMEEAFLYPSSRPQSE